MKKQRAGTCLMRAYRKTSTMDSKWMETEVYIHTFML